MYIHMCNECKSVRVCNTLADAQHDQLETHGWPIVIVKQSIFLLPIIHGNMVFNMLIIKKSTERKTFHNLLSETFDLLFQSVFQTAPDLSSKISCFVYELNP